MVDPKVYLVCKILILVWLLPATGWAQPGPGTTDYSLTLVGGIQVVVADSSQSASAFYKKIKVDLEKTPILNWSWRKELLIDPGNELDKSGDDFVARIYVVKSGGLFFWNTVALNYVWSYQHKRNDTWNNPFAGDKGKMLAQRDASDPQATWFKEQRNVAMDFKALLGKDIRQIDGVAIMTDSDNSGLSARALYGDIYFSSRQE